MGGMKNEVLRWEGGRNHKGETFCNDGHVNFLDCSDGFTDEYICQNFSNCIFLSYAVYYMQIIPHKFGREKQPI